ncbi:MAG TPA: PAS domain-containing protein [Flavitalea sp.]|nr:PAS domain-containing protein [Flavitalea sp.]
MKQRISPSLQLAFIFLVFGISWILITDFVSENFAAGNNTLFINLQHFKGILFIFISALLIYFVSKKLYAHIDNATRKQEEALQRYNMLGMATNDAIWDLNLKTNECYTNRTLQEMFGYAEVELSDNHSWWDNNLHPDDRNRVIESMDYKLSGGGTVWQDEYRFRCKDGSFKRVFDRGFILRDKDGKPFRIIGAMQDVTEQRALQSQLSDQRLQHKNELAHSVIRAQEFERKKVGEELHDNINQLLGVVKLYIEHAQADPEMRDDLLKKSSVYLLQAIEEIRSISRSLMPPTLKDIGLIDSLAELIRSMQVTGKLEIELKTSGFNEEVLLDDMKLMTYRIVQEQLNNIMKHATASHVSIIIFTTEEHVILEIKDNGKGFDVNSPKTGIGFKNMRNRLEVFNGTMKTESSPGQGCLLHVEFGIRQPENDLELH